MTGAAIRSVTCNGSSLLGIIPRAYALNSTWIVRAREAYESDFAGLEHDTYETRERGHGREEYRCYTVLHATAGVRQAADWAGLTTIGICYSERTVGGVTGEELRYFIGSKKARANVTYFRSPNGSAKPSPKPWHAPWCCR